ncbi:glycosyltransferase family 2 protein [Candidatus Kaiserbacteria bacterium]|nr:glycosyltransferase family 2 protein [Candidatus Kaiserbacteria bacterium]
MPIPPVALIIFNRPLETGRVFAAIRQARPSRLLVIADGPRHDGERELCDSARAVIDTVDWPCVVEKNYADVNMGCRERIISGINWVFEQTERAIILEDDCLPHPTFFPFCAELLEKYKDDERVMTITGLCLFQKKIGSSIQESYFPTLLPQTTGWATWRRAWKLYDPDMQAWPALRDARALAPTFHHPAGYERFERVWDDYYYQRPGVKDSWDGQWAFACVRQGAVCLTPTVNLISNIGFNARGTHSHEATDQSDMPLYPMQFPLIHPAELVINREVDALFYRYSLGIDRKWRYRVVRPLKTYFPGIYRALKKLVSKT